MPRGEILQNGAVYRTPVSVSCIQGFLASLEVLAKGDTALDLLRKSCPAEPD